MPAFLRLAESPRPRRWQRWRGAAGFSCFVAADHLISATFIDGEMRAVKQLVRGSLLAARSSHLIMLLDFEIQRCTRRCAATDRTMEPGEVCYSVLEVRGADIVRKDFSKQAWSGPPAEAFGWWKSRIPEPSAKRIKLAPNDVLVELFEQLADRPDSEDMRYVLALLLVRRRVFRLEAPAMQFGKQSAAADVETVTLFCPKRETTYEVSAVTPTGERIEEIQQHLSELLIAGAEEQDMETRRLGDKEKA
jgi:hypothetical protein